MEGSSDSESELVSPYQKQMLLKSPTFDGENSYVSSIKDGCESPFSSWDSEPETDVSSVVNFDEISEGLFEMEQENQFVRVENTDDSLLSEMDNTSYEEVIKLQLEEALRVSNFKLHLSKQEIIELNIRVENSRCQLDNARKELELKEKELHKQKQLSEEEISKMKIQIDERENQLGNVRQELKLKEKELQKKKVELDAQIPHYYVDKVANMAEQLEVAKEQLKISKDEIAILRKELDSKSYKIRGLQDRLKVIHENLAKLEWQVVLRRNQIQLLENLRVQKLNSDMLDLKAKFSLVKDEIHYDIASLSEMNLQLTSKLEKCASRNHELENKLRQYEAEKLKQEELHATEIIVANKEFDKLVIERDEANAKIDKLNAEIFRKNDQISNLKRYISG